MLAFAKTAGAALLVSGICALAGCQDQSRDTAPVAPETFNRPAGVADNNGGGISSPQPNTGQQQVGTQARSANLGGGTVHDPNAGAMGGGN